MERQMEKFQHVLNEHVAEINRLRAGSAQAEGQLTEVKGQLTQAEGQLTEVKGQLAEAQKELRKRTTGSSGETGFTHTQEIPSGTGE